MNEELLREAFQLGQQWVHDTESGKEPINFNDWFKQKQLEVNNCVIPDVSNRRGLLIAFLQWFFDNESKIDGDLEAADFVNIYLKSN